MRERRRGGGLWGGVWWRRKIPKSFAHAVLTFMAKDSMQPQGCVCVLVVVDNIWMSTLTAFRARARLRQSDWAGLFLITF